jgi:hypothetical protein
VARETIHLIGFSEDDRWGIEIGPHKIEFRHPRCAFSVELPMAEFRRIDTVDCSVCGNVLGTFTEMVRWLDESLMAARKESHRKLRGTMRRNALRLHERLMHG